MVLKKGNPKHDSLKEAARIEAGIRKMLEAGNFKGFTDTFEDLHGLVQLPGIAAQRLMQAGYGFAGEGDWKTAALVRAMKTMASGLKGGNSFMEDYTYHLEPGNEMVLGAHMLGNLSVHHNRKTFLRNSPPGYRWQGGSGQAGLYRKRRPCTECNDH